MSQKLRYGKCNVKKSECRNSLKMAKFDGFPGAHTYLT